jgi:hypothetical protein
MDIKKINASVKIENSVNIFLDPIKISKESINIITDPARNINYDKVFNLPGDYELNNVLIRGFAAEKYIFLIKIDLTVLYFQIQPTEQIINQIQSEFNQIDCVITSEIKNPEMFLEKLGVKIFITLDKPLKIQGFDFVRSSNLKINPKKLTETSCLLLGSK